MQRPVNVLRIDTRPVGAAVAGALYKNIFRLYFNTLQDFLGNIGKSWET